MPHGADALQSGTDAVCAEEEGRKTCAALAELSVLEESKGRA
jgi:hypothetical protein